MSADRPINADVPSPAEPPDPAGGSPEKPAPAAPKPPPAPAPRPAAATPRRRRPMPLTPILLAGLVVVAIAFIAAAVIGGTGGGGDHSGGESAAPAPSIVAESPAEDEGEDSTDSQDAADLGFPAFATNNTTRVGGADPAANAAAVALAVFPATTPSQRPRDVTLVDDENWAGAIAAGALMAPPVRAPVLYSSAGSLPAATEQALAMLGPERTHEVPAGGAARTAADVARLRDRLFPGPPGHIVIAPESAPEFAAPAAAWAARSGDPVLFAGSDDLPQPTVEYLEAHNKAPIYVLGPSSAISSKVVREAGRIGGPVKRVAGEDPVANSIALARYADGEFGWNINDPGHGFVIARQDAPLDAAAAAPLSASGTWGPLLLTDSAGTLPAALRDYFLDVKPGYTDNPTRAFYNHVWVIGDQEAIDVNQQAELNELAELARIDGDE